MFTVFGISSLKSRIIVSVGTIIPSRRRVILLAFIAPVSLRISSSVIVSST